MVRFSRGGWLPCLLVSLVLAQTERLAAQEAPPTAASAPPPAAPTAPPPAAASAPPSAALASEPPHRVRRRRRLTRTERRRLRDEARAQPTNPGVPIGAALMIVGGTMVIGSAASALPRLVGGDGADFSTSGTVVLAAGAVVLAIGTVVLIMSLSNHRVPRYAWSTLAPPTAAGSAPSMVLLRF